MISAACLATSVPVIPIANPTSAFLSAGASFVPSPVTATTSPSSLSPVTNRYLSSGLDLASTLRDFQIALNAYMFLTPSSTSAALQSQGDLPLQFLHINPPILS